MADYTIKRLEEVEDVLGDYPGEMRMMTDALEAEQVAFSYRRMPQHTGGKGPTGTGQREEEIYYVASGSCSSAGTTVERERGAPCVLRGDWRSVGNRAGGRRALHRVESVPGGRRGRRYPRILARVR